MVNMIVLSSWTVSRPEAQSLRFLNVNCCCGCWFSKLNTSAFPEEGTGGPDPPGKSQVIWVSIGNKQLDPPPSLEKVGPPLER